MNFKELLASGVEFVVETASIEENQEIWKCCFQLGIVGVQCGRQADLRFWRGEYQGWNPPGGYREAGWHKIPSFQWREINDAADNDPTSFTGLADVL